MRVLWMCNIMLPRIAGVLAKEASNKEGWLTGLSDALLSRRDSTVTLGVCFPVAGTEEEQKGLAEGVQYYAVAEDTVHEERYDPALEEKLRAVTEDFKPDLVHIFGTEFAHSLAMARAFGRPERTLVGIQGVCAACAAQYTADLPRRIVTRSLFRDLVRQDNIRRQQQKFVLRAEREKELLRLVRHVTGRTDFDRESVMAVNPQLIYHFMNETMRTGFYTGAWSYGACLAHSIFFSQGNYPLKGLHYGIEAAGRLRREEPKHYGDIHLYVAGDVITAYDTLRDKLKISSYGKYLRELTEQYGMQKNITFLGKLDAAGMKEWYLKCQVFVSPSIVENSPNSVGEAMLLGVPTVSSDGGGVKSMLTDGTEGLLFPAGDIGGLKACLERIFEMGPAAQQLGARAAQRAVRTHDAETNYRRLLAIYAEICGTGNGPAE